MSLNVRTDGKSTEASATSSVMKNGLGWEPRRSVRGTMAMAAILPL